MGRAKPQNKQRAGIPSTNGVNFEVKEITPQLAEEWLGRNLHNRKLSERHAEKIAGAIERGEFEFNAEPIQFDKNDRLLNGQHRLAAVVKARKPIKALVVTGLPPQAQETMDTGNRRTLADVLELRGEGSASNVANLIRNVWRYDNGHLGSKMVFPTNQQGIQFFEENPGLRGALTAAWRIVRRIPFMTLGQLSALYYVFSRIDQEDADFFFARLDDTDGLGTGDPIYVLRKWLERQAILPPGRRASQATVFAVAIKAWNSYRRGEQVSALTYRPGGRNPEAMPIAE